MKLVLALFVFFLTLGLTYELTAAEAAPAECTADTKNSDECHQSKGESHGANHGKERQKDAPKAHVQESHGQAAGGHGGGHGNISERMNSLFPQPAPDTRLGNRPAQAKPISPRFLAQVSAPSVKLTWTEATGASEYHIQVATDPNFKWLVANEHFVKGTTYEFNKPEAGKRYYWRVAAFQGQNVSTHTKSLFNSSAFDVK